jgi:hypothetical protein
MTRLRCASSAIVRRCARDGHPGTCAALGEVAHSLWTEVCASHNCATTPARPTGGVMSKAYGIGQPMEAPAWHRVTTSTASPPARLLPRSFPRRRIVPVSRRPRNVIRREWTEVRVHHRLPSQCKQGGRSPCRARRREEAGRSTRGKACAFCQLAECRKPLPERSASRQEYRRCWAPGGGRWRRTRCPHW